VIEYGVLYKEKLNLSDHKHWNYYIFLSKSEMIFFDKEVEDISYTDKLSWDLLEEDDFERASIHPKLGRKIVSKIFELV